MPASVDFLVVGAGFAGLVLAERLSTQLGKTCLVVDRRSHIGGNAHDEYDAAGVLVHRYGPHYFRTNSDLVRNYLSQFTAWLPAEYRVLSHAEGRLWPFPISLATFEQFIGRPSTSEEFAAWLERERRPIAQPANSEEFVLSKVGPRFYAMFYEHYTRKQWGRPARELEPGVCGRVPVRLDRNHSYVSDAFQALPRDGYHRLFQNMLLAAAPRVEVRLNADYREVAASVAAKHLIYTGPIDEYYGHRFGRLPYRTLRFEFESFDAEQLKARAPIVGKSGFWQEALQINYPAHPSLTRVVELKHATGQQCDATTIVREYPGECGPGQEPYYPVPAAEPVSLYRRYRELADTDAGVTFVGRLANYRYYNMDQIVALALQEFEKLRARFGPR